MTRDESLWLFFPDLRLSNGLVNTPLGKTLLVVRRQPLARLGSLVTHLMVYVSDACLGTCMVRGRVPLTFLRSDAGQIL